MHLNTPRPCLIACNPSGISSNVLKRQWIAVTLLLLLLGMIALPHDITIAQFFEQETLPRAVEDVLDRAETFAHGIGIAAILLVFS